MTGAAMASACVFWIAAGSLLLNIDFTVARRTGASEADEFAYSAAASGKEPTTTGGRVSLLVAFCNLSRTTSLVNKGDFDSLTELALSCQNGHALVAQALLTAGLGHSSPNVRKRAVVRLGVAAAHLADRGEAGGGLLETCVAALSERAAGDAHPFVRASAADALGEVATSLGDDRLSLASDCIETLMRRPLSDRRYLGYMVRSHAAKSLGRMAVHFRGAHDDLTSVCASALSVALLDRERAVRETAATLLGEIALSAVGDGVVEQIVEAMSKTALDDAALSVREIAAQVLAKVAMEMATPRLDVAVTCADMLSQKALDDGEFVIRLVAAEVLGRLAGRVAGTRDDLAERWVSALTEKALLDSRPGGLLLRKRAVELLGQVAQKAVAKRSDRVALRCMSALMLHGLADRDAVVRTRSGELLQLLSPADGGSDDNDDGDGDEEAGLLGAAVGARKAGAAAVSAAGTLGRMEEAVVVVPAP